MDALTDDFGKDSVLRSASYLFKDSVKLDMIKRNILSPSISSDLKLINEPIYSYQQTNIKNLGLESLDLIANLG